MAQILWKDGKEPPDAAVTTGEGKSVATYTGPVEETEATAEAEAKEEQEDANRPNFDEIFARLQTRAAEVVGAGMRPQSGKVRPQSDKKAQNEEKRPQCAAPAKSEKKQQRVTPRAPTGMSVKTPKASPRAVMARRMTGGDMTGSLPRRRMPNEDCLNIVGDDFGTTPTLFMLTRGTAVPKSDPEVIRLETNPMPENQLAEVIPIGIPLSDEQRRREDFYQQTGVRATDLDIRALLEPSWSIAEALSPRENARRLWIGIRNCGYDAELMGRKAKRAVHDFLHKRRPIAKT